MKISAPVSKGLSPNTNTIGLFGGRTTILTLKTGAIHSDDSPVKGCTYLTEVYVNSFLNYFGTLKKPENISVIRINWLVLFKEIFGVYCKHCTKSLDIHC
jgi:hypothetical protein